MQNAPPKCARRQEEEQKPPGRKFKPIERVSLSRCSSGWEERNTHCGLMLRAAPKAAARPAGAVPLSVYVHWPYCKKARFPGTFRGNNTSFPQILIDADMSVLRFVSPVRMCFISSDPE